MNPDNDFHTHIDTEEQKAISSIQKLKGLALSATEAQLLRERLSAYTDLHIAQPELSVKKFAYGSQFFTRFFPHSFYTYTRAGIAGMLVIVLIIGSTGVSYAAENSLPGQPLYAIKVSVAEPIQGALIAATTAGASGTTAEAAWQSELAERRLTEAGALASENNLATSTQQYLQTAVAAHVALAEQDADTLAATGNETDALTVRTDLESKLSRHAEFLNAIASHLAAAGDATTTDTVLALLQNVVSEQKQVALAQQATEAVIAADASATTTPSTLTATSTGDTGIDVAIATDDVAGTPGVAISGDSNDVTGNAVADNSADTASTTTEDAGVGADTDANNPSTLTVPDAVYPKTHSALFKLLQSMLSATSTASSTSSGDASTTESIRAAWITAELNKLDGIPAGITNQNLLPQELQSATTSAGIVPNQ